VKSVTTQRAILVVEADRALRDLITWTLRRDTYFVLAVTDGATALEVAQANPFSLILLDPIGLQLDGPDICRQSRAFPETASSYNTRLSTIHQQRVYQFAYTRT
jgi:DNA-binding response OmpR family regulator